MRPFRASWAGVALWLLVPLALPVITAAAAGAALGMQATLQSTAMAATAGEAPQQAAMYIPRILHQSYLPDEATLDRMSTSPRSHFRRDWRRSCQVHNPGFQYMFWNESLAQTFVSTHYPHMLSYYNAVDKFVLKSDILRVMILDKLGGVWLDIDTECFAPVEPILRGFHMVAQAEWSFQLCNSHMAGVPGHPVWKQLMDWFITKVKANVTDPLKHTGPVALTTLLKARIQPANPSRNMSAIVGSWVDPDYPQSKFRAYGLQEAWYLPCKWAKSYMSPCQGQLARGKALVRQLANGVNVSLELAAKHDTPPAIKQLVEAALTFRHVRGSHEYANSWTRWAYSDGLKSLIRSQEALHGLQPFFSTAQLFEEYSQWVQGGCGQSPEDVDARLRYQICPAVLRRAAAAGACRVLSIRGRHDQLLPNATLPVEMETFVANTYGCDVRVITLQPRRQAEVVGRVTIASEPMQLGPAYDQYSHPPTFTLPGLLNTLLKPDESLSLLHIDCGQDCRLWEVMNQLQLTGSLDLKRAGSLLLDLSLLSARRRHMLNTVYQHMYQEAGFVGYSWGRTRMPGTLRRAGGSALVAEGARKALLANELGLAGSTGEAEQAQAGVVAGKELLTADSAGGSAAAGVLGAGAGGLAVAGQPALLGSSGFAQDAATSVGGEQGGNSRDLQAAHKKGKKLGKPKPDAGQPQGNRWLLQQQGRASDFSLPPLRLGFARVL